MKNHAVMPGDLRTPTVKLSYNPGYTLSVMISSIAEPEDDYDGSLEVPRLKAVIVDVKRSMTMPYAVKASWINQPENLVMRGEQ